MSPYKVYNVGCHQLTSFHCQIAHSYFFTLWGQISILSILISHKLHRSPLRIWQGGGFIYGLDTDYFIVFFKKGRGLPIAMSASAQSRHPLVILRLTKHGEPPFATNRLSGLHTHTNTKTVPILSHRGLSVSECTGYFLQRKQ